VRPFDDIDRLADWQALDKVALPARDAVDKILSKNRTVADLLHGVPLGHSLHAVLVQLTIGSFASAALLDTVPRTRRPATALIAVGVVSALPTVASGWADYSQAYINQQRVGVVHAAANGTMIAGYVASLAARAKGHGFRGALWGWAALAVGTVGATLGGHMTYHQGVGVNHAESISRTGPDDWTDAGSFDDLPEGRPTRRVVGDVGIVVVRHGDTVHALAERCAHLSGPLSQGSLEDVDGEGECLVCPWHGSVFRVADGGVVHGPSIAPQPTFHTRVQNGRLEVRVVGYAAVPAS
jgi:nitrite reductase/ring-hydroxylating ferredoxin subunit